MHKEDLAAWEANATFWDDYMGDESNFFHCDMVRPQTDNLLQPTANDLVLDIACGNGNYAAWLAARGVQVVAFDYSPTMVALARKRRAVYTEQINFQVCDATDYDALMSLRQAKPFTKAVANMAIMDISDIEPLFSATYAMLAAGGSFVFSTHHACFTYPNGNYFTSAMHKGVAVEGQPQLQCYYHRSLQELLNLAFKVGFVLAGFHEIPFEHDATPIIMIVKLTKAV